MSFMSFLFGPQHTVERVQPTLNRQYYRREIVEHRTTKLSDAEKTWLQKYHNDRQTELVDYSLCSPQSRFCHGTVSNQVTLAEHKNIRILVAGNTGDGKNACLNTLFTILGSEQDIGVNDHGEGDLNVVDHRLVVGGRERSIVFTNIKGFAGENKHDDLLLDALILGKLRNGQGCNVDGILSHPAVLHEQCLALIFVVSCQSYTVESARRSDSQGGFQTMARYFQKLRQVIKRNDIVPITIVTKVWDETGQIRADYQQVLRDAAEVVGSAPCHIFPFENFPAGTPHFQERLKTNRLNGLMALQEALVQAELRLNRKNLMEDEELAGKKIVSQFMESTAEKYAWNEARYSKVMANLKTKWLNLPDHDSYLSPQDFIAICENARQDPAHSPFLSRVMAAQVLEGMEAMREEWLQQDE